MYSHLRPLRRAVATIIPLGTVVAALLVPGGSPAATAPVSVFPIAGSQVAPPQAQITFRGLPVSRLGTIIVTGSHSGDHIGTLLGDSDGRGGSFIPRRAFTPGETVTVRTRLNIVGSGSGTFRFKVATPAGALPNRPFPPTSRVRGDVYHFHSRPDISPAAVRVTRQSSRTARGYIFMAPWYGPLQNGPMVLDSNGGVVWFKALPRNILASDVRVQTYHGQPVLTWWQGYFGAGVGAGVDVINNTSYQEIKTVSAGNGLSADLHEFYITPQGTALILAEYPVRWNASSIHKPSNAILFDSVVQEIDIPTGLVLFQWDSLDHVPLGASYQSFPSSRGSPFDYFHANSVEPDRDGNLILSSRSTSAIYKIDHSSGRVLWVLGGKRSTFRFGRNASPAYQHDVVVRAKNDALVSMFDNGAGLSNAHTQSRVLWLRLDFKHKLATNSGELEHSPAVLSQYAGSEQELPGGDSFVGWGEQPYLSEYNSRGKLIFDASFKDVNASYRAYRFRWNGYPQTLPAVAGANSGRQTTVYASWNGATTVASWRVLAGSSATSLRPAGSARRGGFETWIRISRQSYVQAQALDSKGHVLGTSAVTRSR